MCLPAVSGKLAAEKSRPHFFFPLYLCGILLGIPQSNKQGCATVSHGKQSWEDHGDMIASWKSIRLCSITFTFTEILVALSVLTITRHFPNEELAIIATAMRYFKLL